MTRRYWTLSLSSFFPPTRVDDVVVLRWSEAIQFEHEGPALVEQDDVEVVDEGHRCSFLRNGYPDHMEITPGLTGARSCTMMLNISYEIHD